MDWLHHKRFAADLYFLRKFLLKEVSSKTPKNSAKMRAYSEALNALDKLRSKLDDACYIEHGSSPYYEDCLKF